MFKLRAYLLFCGISAERFTAEWEFPSPPPKVSFKYSPRNRRNRHSRDVHAAAMAAVDDGWATEGLPETPRHHARHRRDPDAEAEPVWEEPEEPVPPVEKRRHEHYKRDSELPPEEWSFPGKAILLQANDFIHGAKEYVMSTPKAKVPEVPANVDPVVLARATEDLDHISKQLIAQGRAAGALEQALLQRLGASTTPSPEDQEDKKAQQEQTTKLVLIIGGVITCAAAFTAAIYSSLKRNNHEDVEPGQVEEQWIKTKKVCG
mmetsp:Transcript_3249/g.7745  ORF Transcript_3249/g.7745 Transcript_3249/m.7745 type:complete len:262 (+) Transcript_3249:83-868(+)